MKIKTRFTDYEALSRETPEKHRLPGRSSFLLRTAFRLLSAPELRRARFRFRQSGMEKLGRHEPCLILMNHSSFLDLKIASRILYPRPYHIVCTSDGFVGRAAMMRGIGCIPTKKFVSEPELLTDMEHVLHTLRSSVLMFPEASYSFDGTATPLPESLGRCLKHLGVPVVMIRTYGAFAYDPLYNNLQRRRVEVSADVTYLLSPEEIAEKDARELNDLLARQFSFDNFRWQQENGVRVNEPFRADHLNRVLYKCPRCLAEGKTVGEGVTLRCTACGAAYTLTEDGRMQAEDGRTEFPHIPDWYAWERACVREEIEKDRYHLDIPVRIGVMLNTRAIYMVGEGRLTHDKTGFTLTGCHGRLSYRQKPLASYSLYADYHWYEIGDMICLGNRRILYYCFPLAGGDVVAKTRLAAEELYKLCRAAVRLPAPAAPLAHL